MDIKMIPDTKENALNSLKVLEFALVRGSWIIEFFLIFYFLTLQYCMVKWNKFNSR